MGHTDRNQAEIVAALRKVGASVAITSGLGRGFPDLVVGYRKVNTLLEVKDGTAPPSKRRLTPDEQDWHDGWRGQVCVVETVEEALLAIMPAVPTMTCAILDHDEEIDRRIAERRARGWKP